jgi:hypothetical protein
MYIWMLTLPLVLFCRCGTPRSRGRDGRGANSSGTGATIACRSMAGQRRRRDDAGAAPAHELRAGQRWILDDAGDGPVHESRAEAGGGMEDPRRRFE